MFSASLESSPTPLSWCSLITQAPPTQSSGICLSGSTCVTPCSPKPSVAPTASSWGADLDRSCHYHMCSPLFPTTELTSPHFQSPVNSVPKYCLFSSFLGSYYCQTHLITSTCLSCITFPHSLQNRSFFRIFTWFIHQWMYFKHSLDRFQSFSFRCFDSDKKWH